MKIDADEKELLESVERGEWKSARRRQARANSVSRYAKATFPQGPAAEHPAVEQGPGGDSEAGARAGVAVSDVDRQPAAQVPRPGSSKKSEEWLAATPPRATPGPSGPDSAGRARRAARATAETSRDRWGYFSGPRSSEPAMELGRFLRFCELSQQCVRAALLACSQMNPRAAHLDALLTLSVLRVLDG